MVGGLWEQKQFVHCIVITVISSHRQRKQYNVIRPQKRGKLFIIGMISCNQDT